MALFCKCGRHNEVLIHIERQEKHLIFELLEETIEQTGLLETQIGLLVEIRDLLKAQGPGKEAKLIIPIGIPVEQ